MPLIVVGIASYRDKEVIDTIDSLFKEAKRPENVRAVVVLQLDMQADVSIIRAITSSKWRDQLVVRFWDYKQCLGICWARYQVQELVRLHFNPWVDYLLQIDSHMRFIRNWDTVLTRLLDHCPSAKPVLTCYPAETLDAGTYTMLCGSHFAEADGLLRLKGSRVYPTGLELVLPSLFWAAGFSFSKASVVFDAPYDANYHFLFFGEEIIMALRLRKAGYEFFSPTRAICSHRWSRIGRPVHTELFQLLGTAMYNTKLASISKVLRELADHPNLEDMFGVDFRSKHVTTRAKLGGLGESYYKSPLERSLKFL